MAGEAFVSGSDILSNPGNAALGYSGGVEYNANPADSNPFGTIQSTLSSLQAQDAARRESMRQQGLKEQGDLADFLIGTGKSAFNLPGADGQGMGFNPLEEDRTALNAAADDLRKKVMSNPKNWKFDPEIQKKIADFKQLTTHASIRSVDVANKLAKAAASNNPEERARIMQSIEGTKGAGLTDFKSPEPYMPEETFNIEKFYSPDVLSRKNKEAWQTYSTTAGLDKDGNEIQKDIVGMADSELDFRPKAKRGSAEYANALNLVRSYYASPQSQDVGSIQAMNAQIDRINAQRGYDAKNPHYIPHVAEVLPNGQIKPNPLPVEDVAYALLGEKYGALMESPTLKRTASQIAKEKADMSNDRQRVAQAWETLRQSKEKAAQEADKLSKDERKERDELLGAQEDVLRVMKMVTPDKNTPTADVVLSKMPAPMKEQIAGQIGISPEDLKGYDIKTLSPADLGVRHMAAIQYRNKQGGLGLGTEKPEYVYSVVPKGGGVADAMVVVGYKDERPVLDKNGDPKLGPDNKVMMEKFTNTKTMTLADAVGSYVDGSHNYKAPATRVDKAHQYLKDVISGNKSQAASASSIPESIKKIAGASNDITPVEDAGQTYYKIGTKYYYADGREIK